MSDPNSTDPEFSQLNSSSSKMRYTFAKEERFRADMTKELHGKFYELPSVKSGRAAAIGYGTKSNFTKDGANSPSPQRYNISSFTEEAKTHKKGFVFGESRENMKLAGFSPEVQTPGPGRYEKSSTLSKISYSIRNKPKLPSLNNNPGPGQYEAPQAIHKEGSYFLSKLKNSGCSYINPEPLHKKDQRSVPGPGHYEIDKANIANNCRVPLSQYNNTKAYHFPHEQRKTFYKTSVSPGPGAYCQISEFTSNIPKLSPIKRETRKSFRG